MTEDRNNAQRREDARSAVEHHFYRVNNAPMPVDETEDAVTDLLADLFHLANEFGFDLDALHERAYVRYIAEHENGGNGAPSGSDGHRG